MNAERDDLDAVVRRVNEAIWRAPRRGFRGAPDADHPAGQPLPFCGHEGSPDALEDKILACCEQRLSDVEKQRFLEQSLDCNYCMERLAMAKGYYDAARVEGAQTPDTALEVVFHLLSDLRYLGGVVMRVLEPLNVRSVDLNVEVTPVPVPIRTRGVKGPTPGGAREPVLQSSFSGQMEIGSLCVDYAITRLEDGYRVNLIVTEADGRPTARELWIERSVGGTYAGMERAVEGEHTLTLPAPFGQLELTLYEEGTALGRSLVIREEPS